jgi:site-specific recombinase XerD
MRLSNAIPHFDRQMAADGRSAHTRAAYLRDLQALSRWVGKDPALSTITPDHLARFLISDQAQCAPTGQPRAAISVNRTVRCQLSSDSVRPNLTDGFLRFKSLVSLKSLPWSFDGSAVGAAVAFAA